MSEEVTDVPWDEPDGIKGCSDAGERSVVPIVFVHGNGGDAEHWKRHIRDFARKGVCGDYLWSVDIPDNNPTHKHFASNIDSFVDSVLSYTEFETVQIVSHSLGVTSSRYWMEEYDTYSQVKRFVGIAGANHGIDLCPPAELCSLLPRFSSAKPCQFFSTNSMLQTELQRLNEDDETKGNVEYYTIRGKDDILFQSNLRSPILEGAEENVEIDAGHMGAKNSDTSISLIYKWCIEQR